MFHLIYLGEVLSRTYPFFFFFLNHMHFVLFVQHPHVQLLSQDHIKCRCMCRTKANVNVPYEILLFLFSPFWNLHVYNRECLIRRFLFEVLHLMYVMYNIGKIKLRQRQADFHRPDELADDSRCVNLICKCIRFVTIRCRFRIIAIFL